MIPKKIHYCWFGRGPKPGLAEKCIVSWRKFLPDYEIIEWNEDNFDVNEIPYTAQAYAAKKYAFVSDYARFKILYEYGGLYFDTDVEIIRPLDDIIAAGPFMGCEGKYHENQSPMKLGVAAGLGLAAESGMEIYRDLINLYSTTDFVSADGQKDANNVVTHVTRLLISKGFQNVPSIQKVAGVTIYPIDYFCPFDFDNGKLTVTANTRSIHHYSGSWLTPSARIITWLTQHHLKWVLTTLSAIKHSVMPKHK